MLILRGDASSVSPPFIVSTVKTAKTGRARRKIFDETQTPSRRPTFGF
jgi:hypothetical protein